MKRRSSVMLFLAMVGWAVFGSWALWSNEVLGHAVAFLFFSISFLGLAVQLFGAKFGLLPSVVALVAIAGASEYLQPRFTSRPAEWADVTSDLVGVGAGFVVVSIGLLASRRAPLIWLAIAGLCIAALGGSLAFASLGSGSVEERFEDRFGCWGKGLDRIASVPGGPIIQVDGQFVRVGGEEAEPLIDGIVSPDSDDLRCSVLGSESYSVVATVVPETIETGGPMRIFTSSLSTSFGDENTHLGQEFDMLSIRVRSGGQFLWETVPDVFVAGERVTVAMVVSGGEVNVYVDGEWRAVFELAGSSLREWRKNVPILIGDEFTRDRTFEGDIESVSFFDRGILEGDLLLGSDES